MACVCVCIINMHNHHRLRIAWRKYHVGQRRYPTIPFICSCKSMILYWHLPHLQTALNMHQLVGLGNCVWVWGTNCDALAADLAAVSSDSRSENALQQRTPRKRVCSSFSQQGSTERLWNNQQSRGHGPALATHPH